MQKATLLSAATAALLCCGCGRNPANGGAYTVRLVVGDTTIVRNVSGSVWGDGVRVVEELRIGMVDGPEQYAFGQISQVSALADGSIVVVDGGARKIRLYDSAGTYVRDIGRPGQGPGEYSSLGPMGLRPDGRIIVHDVDAMKANVYSEDGVSAVSWPLPQSPSFLRSSRSITVDTAGVAYIPVLARTQKRGEVEVDFLAAYLRLAADGKVIDTLRIASRGPARGFSWGDLFVPREFHALLPTGALLYGYSDRYVFDIVSAKGTVLRVEKAWQPLDVQREEKSNLEAYYASADRQIISMSRNAEGKVDIEYAPLPNILATKPAYRDITAAADRRIWVTPYVVSEYRAPTDTTRKNKEGKPIVPRVWYEKPTYDVFESDGAYLGRVTLGWREDPQFMRGDHVWVVRAGELDEEYVVRYRIERPSQRR